MFVLRGGYFHVSPLELRGEMGESCSFEWLDVFFVDFVLGAVDFMATLGIRLLGYMRG